jgi:hypothetical protein
MRKRRQVSSVAVLVLFLTAACASKPAPAPAPPPAAAPAPVPAKPPDEADTLVASLTQTFGLDAIQREKTRQLARQLVERNTAIRAGWDRGGRVHPEALLASKSQFEKEFLSILTDPQRKKYQEERDRLLVKGRRVDQPK